VRGASGAHAHSDGTAGIKAVLYAARPPITKRPPNSTPSSPPAVFADAEERKEPPEPGLSHYRERYEQPLYPLKPEARLARALVELDPRQAPAPKLDARHGALHSTDAPQ
jgi:hypothetical protein